MAPLPLWHVHIEGRRLLLSCSTVPRRSRGLAAQIDARDPCAHDVHKDLAVERCIDAHRFHGSIADLMSRCNHRRIPISHQIAEICRERRNANAHVGHGAVGWDLDERSTVTNMSFTYCRVSSCC